METIGSKGDWGMIKYEVAEKLNDRFLNTVYEVLSRIGSRMSYRESICEERTFELWGEFSAVVNVNGISIIQRSTKGTPYAAYGPSNWYTWYLITSGLIAMYEQENHAAAVQLSRVVIVRLERIARYLMTGEIPSMEVDVVSDEEAERYLEAISGFYSLREGR